MKFTLSSRQTDEYLKKADVIRVEWRDRRIIPELTEKYPEAEINLLLPHPSDAIINWTEINNYNILSKNKLMVGSFYTEYLNEARAKGIRHYYAAPICTFEELNDAKRAGVCGVYLGAPLFFRLDAVKEFDIPIFAIANEANATAFFQRPNGVTSAWLRPEDVELYSEYIDVIEFCGDLKQEQALYRIYAEQKAWSGPLDMLIRGLNFPDCKANRMVPPLFGEKRINCGQVCQETGGCHICERLLQLADPDKMRAFQNSI